MHYPVIVVGAGAAGLAACDGLQRAGVRCLSIAPGESPALVAAAGMLLPTLDDFSTAVQLAADWSYEAWVDFLAQCGAGSSLRACRVLHYDQISPRCVDAFDGRVINTRDLYEVLRSALTNTVESWVTQCRLMPDLCEVQTEDGTFYTCETLILATGVSISPPEVTGLPAGAIRSPRSVRGITLRCQWDGLDSIRYWKRDPRTVIYIAPWFDGTVVVGSTIGLDDHASDWRPDEERALLAAADLLVPGLGQAAVLERRVGFRPLSADREPQLRQLGVAGRAQIWSIDGLFRNGVLWMPACAALAPQIHRRISVQADLSGLVQYHL